MAEQAHAGKAQPLETGHNPWKFLPTFYIEAVIKPSARLFSHTAEYARWSLVWLQMLFILLIPVIMGGLRALFHNNAGAVDARTNIFLSTLGVLTVGATVIAFVLKIIAIPLLFFIGAWIQYLIAKIFHGRGRFVSHCFSLQVYQVPLAIIGGLITLVLVILRLPTLFFSPLVSVALFAYGIIINIAVVRGVHNINREQAVISVLVPYVVGLLAIIGALALVAHTIAGTINAIH
jgi:hypothetical protein